MNSTPFTTDNTEHIKEIASAHNDIYDIIIDGGTIPQLRDDACIDLSAAFKAFRPDLKNSTAIQRQVGIRFAQLAPRLGLVQVQHDPATTDFHWARMRCLLAGFGHQAHAELARILLQLYPQCPLDPGIPYEEWMADLRDAHQTCGLPVTLLSIPYQTLARAVGEDDMDLMRADVARYWWLRPAVAVHIIKHCRLDGESLRIRYLGGDYIFENKKTQNLVMARFPGAAQVLGFSPSPGRRTSVPVSLLFPAERHVCNLITDSDLLPVDSRTDAHHLLTGPWARLRPDPTRLDGWVQHGLRLDGAYTLDGTRVVPCFGSDDDVIRYDWAVYTDTQEEREAYDRFEASRPEIVPDEHWPSDYLFSAFPNIMLPDDPAAYAAIIDAIFLVASARHLLPGAAREFPMMWVMPESGQMEHATNQGKTLLAQLAAQAMTPGIEVLRSTDSSSAPDIRSLVSQWQRSGTVCLDEWRTPKTTTHPLFHDNLQSMITGKAVVLGKVLENSPRPLRLSQPIVASTKCVSLPPDMVNRSVFIFARTLTHEERSNVAVVDMVEGGRLPMLMTLAARYFSTRIDIAGIAPVAMETFRFSIHAAVACAILRLRDGVQDATAFTRVAAAAAAMQTRFKIHLGEAERTGLLTMMENPRAITTRLLSICEGISASECEAWYTMLRDLLARDRRDPAHGVSMPDLVRARGAAMGLDNPSPQDVIYHVMGTRPPMSNPAILNSLSMDLKAHAHRAGVRWAMPGEAGIEGWGIERCQDARGGAVRVFLSKTESLA